LVTRSKLSAFVISYNRQDIIGTTLKALSFADELILVDKSSTDTTADIATPLVDKIMVVPWTPVVEDTRSLACSLCANDWILFLDDDECLTPEAVRFIDRELSSPRADIYRLPQRHHILGVHDEAAYYWPETQIRLFRKGTLEFSPTTHNGFRLISERIYEVPPDNGVAITHLSHANVSHWIQKSNRYTSQHDRVRMLDEGADLVAFAHRSIDKWTHNAADPGGYVSAVGLLRAIYDQIDRLKTWEEERGLDGTARFAEICRNLESRYDAELADLRRDRAVIAPEVIPPAGEVADMQREGAAALLLRTNSVLADVLKQVRHEGENLRLVLKSKGEELAQARAEATQVEARLSEELAQARAEATQVEARLSEELARARAEAQKIAQLMDERGWFLRQLDREARRPWRPFKHYVLYLLLKLLSLMARPFSGATAERFKRSAAKRSPRRFKRILADADVTRT
jgi:hypothetical protein